MLATAKSQFVSHKDVKVKDEAQSTDNAWLRYYAGAEKNANMSWTTEIWPRLCAHLRCEKASGAVPKAFEHVLELAPGGGRLTDLMRKVAGRVTAVDVNKVAVEKLLKPRFANASNVDVHVNDGMGVPMVASSSISLIFSFDSMVHFPPEAIESYVKEFNRVLRPGGYAFFHHANLRACTSDAPHHDKCTIGFTCNRKGTFIRGIYNGSNSCGIPKLARKNPHARNLITCERVAELAVSAGLVVAKQWRFFFGPPPEKPLLHDWVLSGRPGWPKGTSSAGKRSIVDCITLLKKPRAKGAAGAVPPLEV